jgi:hypothetical protein
LLVSNFLRLLFNTIFYPVSQITGDTKGMSGSKSGEREEVKEVEEEWTMDRLLGQMTIKTPNVVFTDV